VCVDTSSGPGSSNGLRQTGYGELMLRGGLVERQLGQLLNKLGYQWKG